MNLEGCALSFNYSPTESRPHARLLLQSLDRWLTQENNTNIPIYVIEHPTMGQSVKLEEFRRPLSSFRVEMDESRLGFPYIEKVYAAALAETIAEENGITQLIYMDWDTIILQRPYELILDKSTKVAASAVQLRNISSLASHPMNGFWQSIYEKCHAEDNPDFRVTSMIDRQEIRPHFNAGLLVIKPQFGLLRQWKENFLAIYQEPELDVFYESDRRYKIFAHQAVLAATILANCTPDEIKLLPPSYNYPLFLVSKATPSERPANLQSLVSVRYEDFYPTDWVNSLACEPSLKAWLDEAIQKSQ